jgi:hypothetical protein
VECVLAVCDGPFCSMRLIRPLRRSMVVDESRFGRCVCVFSRTRVGACRLRFTTNGWTWGTFFQECLSTSGHMLIVRHLKADSLPIELDSVTRDPHILASLVDDNDSVGLVCVHGSSIQSRHASVSSIASSSIAYFIRKGSIGLLPRTICRTAEKVSPFSTESTAACR